ILTVRFDNATVRLLAARDGIAFRTTNPVTFHTNAKTWLQPFRTSYESPYLTTRVARRYGFPALIQNDRDRYTLLTESGTPKGAVSHLTRDLAVRPTTNNWRVVVTGTLARVVDSDLPLTLGRPSRIQDTSWIEPGIAAWTWWADRRSGGTLIAQQQAVDEAAANGWRYVTVDAGWDPQWVPGLVAYAAARHVKIVLWFDADDATPAALDQAHGWGVAGVKVDFLLSDHADRIALMNRIARDAAARRLVVDFHGCTLPRGLQRTWPNVLSAEAVYGAEHATVTPMVPAQNVDDVLIRNVVGSMDYTPVTFSAPGRITTDGHELAEAVAFESGLQHFADTPAAYAARPLAQEVLNGVPAAWDDTRLIDGAPDDHAVIARRDGTTWWVGGLSATPQRTLTVPLAFLKQPGAYLARIITDGPAGLTATDQPVDRDTRLSVPVAANGGFTIELRRARAARSSRAARPPR
ncbi:MAG: hypothetical protein QOF76_3406, partial [Solirubrobacteraceae bacterium]|nr:hypothetical protein [Solirubrobacteraceae bacterium]